MPATESLNTIRRLGFNQFNRRDTVAGEIPSVPVSPVNILNRADSPDVTDQVPLSVINQYIPEKSIGLEKTTIDTFTVNQHIKGGATGYDSGVGWWLGMDGGTAKFFIGDSSGSKITWDGTTLSISGSLVANELHAPDEDTTANSFHVNSVGLMWIGATETNKATAPIRASAAGEMTIGDPTGVHLQLSGPNVRMRSSDYVTGVSGFNIEADLVEAENILARGMMKGATFQYDVVSAVGGQMMVSQTDVLDTDMTALDASTLTVKGTSTFAVNDILLMRATTALGIQEEWLRVTNIASAPTYTVTRDLAASFAADTNPIWIKGTTVVKQGVSDGAAAYSGGWLRLFGEGTNSPYYSVFSRTGVAYNAYSELVRIGNLNGIGGQVSEVYGIFAGDYSANKYFMYDSTSGDLVINGNLNGLFGWGGDGSDGALTITSGTTTLNLDQVYNYSSISLSAGATLAFTGAGSGAFLNCSGNCTLAGTIELRNMVDTASSGATRRDNLETGTGQGTLDENDGGASAVSASHGNGGAGGDSDAASGTPGVGGAGGAVNNPGTAGSGGNSAGGGGGGGGGGGSVGGGSAGSNNSSNNGGNGGAGGTGGGAGGSGGGGYASGNGGNGGNSTSGTGQTNGGNGGNSGASGGDGGDGGNGGANSSGGGAIGGTGGAGGNGYTNGGDGGVGGQAPNGGTGGAGGIGQRGTGGAGGTGGIIDTSGGGTGGRGGDGRTGGNGGTGGAGSTGGTGGRGGDGGGGAAFLALYVNGDMTLTSLTVQAGGGTGGNGGNGGASNGAGGDAGDGGDGSDIIMLCRGTLTGSPTVNNSGGSAGSVGLGNGSGADGAAGTDGSDGIQVISVVQDM